VHQLAEDVWQIPLVPRQGVNAYVIGDVLIDAGMTFHAKKILGELQGRPIAAHALTHVHNDHAGGSKKVSETLGIPVWVGAGDAGALRSGRADITPGRRGAGLMARYGGSPKVEPARELREGDEVGPGFVALDTPGHSPGHVSFWRERDRVLVCGDVFFDLNLLTLAPGLHQPPAVFSYDPERNRESERRLAALQPQLTLFGHGPPLRGAGALEAFTAALPALPA
jgi:hydroxyacylglutathione hydrolase